MIWPKYCEYFRPYSDILQQYSSQVKKADIKRFRTLVIAMVGNENGEHQIDQACVLIFRYRNRNSVISKFRIRKIRYGIGTRYRVLFGALDSDSFFFIHPNPVFLI
jgi:hypothetical protein